MVGTSVAVTVAYSVAPSDERRFHAWALARLSDSSVRAGYVGGSVVAAGQAEQSWRIVFQFQDGRTASEWEQWFVRSGAALDSLIITWQVEGAPTAPPPAPPAPPPRWKLAVVTLSAVFPPVLLFNAAVVPFLGDFPLVARSAALCVAVTIITTWVMMPRLQKWFKHWLYPPASRHRSPPLGAVQQSVRTRETGPKAVTGPSPDHLDRYAPAPQTLRHSPARSSGVPDDGDRARRPSRPSGPRSPRY